MKPKKSMYRIFDLCYSFQVNVDAASLLNSLTPLQENNAWIYDSNQNQDFSLSGHDGAASSLLTSPFNTYKWAPIRRTITDDQLVFLDLSPDYCTSDVKSGKNTSHNECHEQCSKKDETEKNLFFICKIYICSHVGSF